MALPKQVSKQDDGGKVKLIAAVAALGVAVLLLGWQFGLGDVLTGRSAGGTATPEQVKAVEQAKTESNQGRRLIQQANEEAVKQGKASRPVDGGA